MQDVNNSKKYILSWTDTENETCHWDHPTAEAWVSEHTHPITGQRVYLALDTSGCDEGIIGIYDTLAEASNAIGDMYGYDELWVKLD